MTTTYRKTQHVLPQEVVDGFATLGEDLESRNLYSVALRRAGWTLSSISAATGVTRERIRQVVETAPEDITVPNDLPVPHPPLKPVKAKKEYVEPDADKLARLLELQPYAQQNRHNSSENRQAAEDYTALIWEVHDQDGVTLYRLAKRLGVTHGALRFRLARYGYKLPETGRSKVYTRIDPANRLPVS